MSSHVSVTIWTRSPRLRRRRSHDLGDVGTPPATRARAARRLACGGGGSRQDDQPLRGLRAERPLRALCRGAAAGRARAHGRGAAGRRPGRTRRRRPPRPAGGAPSRRPRQVVLLGRLGGANDTSAGRWGHPAGAATCARGARAAALPQRVAGRSPRRRASRPRRPRRHRHRPGASPCHRESSSSPGAGPGAGNVDSPAVTVSKSGDGIKMATFLGTASRRFYGLGPAPRRLRRHLEGAHRRRLDVGQVLERPEHVLVGHRLDRRAGPRARRRQAVPADRRLRPQAAQDRRRHRQDPLDLRLRRRHQEQPQRDRQPAPHKRRRQVPRAGRLAAWVWSGAWAIRASPRIAPSPLAPARRVAPAGAAHPQLHAGLRRQRVLPGRPRLHRGRARLGLRARSLPHAALAGRRAAPIAARWPPTARCCSARRPTPRATKHPDGVEPGDRGLAGAARRHHLHRLRRRSRLRPAAQRPGRRLRLPDRLRPRRHHGADARRQAARADREAVHQGPRRGADARPDQARGAVAGVVLPDRRPAGRRVDRRGDRLGGRQRRIRRRRSLPAAGRLQRDRRQPLPRLAGHPGARHGARAEPGARACARRSWSGRRGWTPPSRRRSSSTTRSSTPPTTTACTCTTSTTCRLRGRRRRPAQPRRPLVDDQGPPDGDLHRRQRFESTPVLWDGRIYIGSRDGWFYCLGDR